jgi:D-alanyl-D-alanine carboxypeptidase
VDGLAAIGSRIAEINAQLARLSVPATPVPAATSRTATASSSATAATRSFDDVLAGAVQSGGQGLATTTTVRTAPARTGVTTATTATTGPTGLTGTTGTTGPTRPAPTAPPRVATATPHAAVTDATASTASTGRLTSSGAPADLARYGNGRIPAAALTSIGGGHRLWAPAAEAFQRLQAAAKRAGVHIGVTDSYRSYAEQVDVARRKGLHSQGGLAAKPGTSEHGWGKSLDLALGADAQRWMRAHAGAYGFTENVSREPWHWTYAAR